VARKRPAGAAAMARKRVGGAGGLRWRVGKKGGGVRLTFVLVFAVCLGVWRTAKKGPYLPLGLCRAPREASARQRWAPLVSHRPGADAHNG
jgi:hypothetical protein